MGNKIIKGLVYSIDEECRNLEMLYPGNELLKYAFSDKDGLKNSLKIEISKDFVRKFLPPEFFLKKKYNSDKEYKDAFDLSYQITLENYLNALKEEVKWAKMRTILN